MWLDGKEYCIRDLLEKEIYPGAKQALLNRGVDKKEVDYYLEEIILQRIKKGINGAIWQKAFIHTNGKRFQDLLEVYTENQDTKKPVHKWKI